MSHTPVSIAIFASGSGTNALKLMHHFKDSPAGQVKLVCTNNPEAGVIRKAMNCGVPSLVLSRRQFRDGRYLAGLLKSQGIEMVVLAGYLKLIPSELVAAFPGRIVNIHPALLPRFGGKGMYGMNVHRAVIEAGETESGITIHLIDERYDEGKTLFQKSLQIGRDWSPETLQQEVLKLEHKYFPQIVEKLCLNVQKTA